MANLFRLAPSIVGEVSGGAIGEAVRNHPPGCSCGDPDCPEWQAAQQVRAPRCDCGAVATHTEGGAWVCDRCGDLTLAEKTDEGLMADTMAAAPKGRKPTKQRAQAKAPKAPKSRKRS